MKHLNILSTVGLGFLTVLLLISIYWLFFQQDVMFVKNTNIVTDKTEYKPGEPIVYQFNYCKTRQSVAIVNRLIVDNFQLSYPVISSDLAVGCHSVSFGDVSVPIIFSRESGHKYHLEITAAYRVNPLRQQFVYLKSNDFKIK